jgi:hypothetical protein
MKCNSFTVYSFTRIRKSFTFFTLHPTQVAEEQHDVPRLTFPEKPLGLPESEGFGYFQGSPGLKFSHDNRFGPPRFRKASMVIVLEGVDSQRYSILVSWLQGQR